MTAFIKRLKLTLLIGALALYLLSSLSYLGFADPTGAVITYLQTDSGSQTSPDTRTDPGGDIVTINLNVIQQDQAWKAYIGNITGALVLRNTNSFSIYEWALDASALGGNIFVSRSGAINWTPIRCANSTNILNEDTALGTSSSSTDSVNRTFNYTIHKSMVISGIGTITNSTCQSIATYVNGSAQVVLETTDFQEILLSDTSNLVYATFIDQNRWGFDSNVTLNITHDFQIIVGENRTDSVGHTYYFYADIS